MLAFRPLRRFGMAALVTAALILPAVAVRADHAESPFDHQVECFEPIPEHASATKSPDEPVELAVMVLGDGVSRWHAHRVVGELARSFRAAGIIIESSYQAVRFDGADADHLIDQARRLSKGKVRAPFDIVHVLTYKDVTSGGDERVVGKADCIGGARFPEHAFSVSEVIGDLTTFGAPLRATASRIMAHELGHLLGGQHHYANCGGGARSDADKADGSVCTLMINAVNVASFEFSMINKAVVRGHANAIDD